METADWVPAGRRAVRIIPGLDVLIDFKRWPGGGKGYRKETY